MKSERVFHYSTWPEGDWFVAQLLDFDLASLGRTEAEAVANLKEAIRLHFTPPVATAPEPVREMRVNVAQAAGHRKVGKKTYGEDRSFTTANPGQW